jgi:hypothetical protein
MLVANAQVALSSLVAPVNGLLRVHDDLHKHFKCSGSVEKAFNVVALEWSSSQAKNTKHTSREVQIQQSNTAKQMAPIHRQTRFFERMLPVNHGHS